MSTFFDNLSVQSLAGIFNSGVGGIKNIADPYLSGYSFIKLLPGNLKQDEMGLDPKFLELLEKTFKEVGGLPRIEMGTTSINGGFTQNEHMYPSEISKNITEVTLRFQEFSGSPYTTEFRKWVEAIRDPESGLYQLSEYGLKHYSMSMLYVNTSPGVGSKSATARAASLEFACLLTGMYPRAIDYDKYNYTAGDHAPNELDQPFSCNFHTGKAIFDAARTHLSTAAFYENMRLAQQSVYDGVLDADLGLTGVKGDNVKDDTSITVVPQF